MLMLVANVVAKARAFVLSDRRLHGLKVEREEEKERRGGYWSVVGMMEVGSRSSSNEVGWLL